VYSTPFVNVLVEDDQHIGKHSKFTNTRKVEKKCMGRTKEINVGGGDSLVHCIAFV
jgi:hypothetical protein